MTSTYFPAVVQAVAWDVSGRFDPTTCIDIGPFAAYEAPAVSDPLEEAA